MLNYHRERFGKLTFRALALRQSESLTRSVEPIANFKPRGNVWRTDMRRWRIDFKISELGVGELTRWRNDRLPRRIQWLSQRPHQICEVF